MKEGFKSRRYNFSNMTVTEFEHAPVSPAKTPFLDFILNNGDEHQSGDKLVDKPRTGS